MGNPDETGGRVMSEANDKAVEEKNPKPKKPPGYRKFHRLLKLVINAPPMRKDKSP